MAIDSADIERLKEIFVTRNDCDKTTEDIRGKINSDSVRLAVIETQLKIITGILAAVGTGVLTILLKLFFGM